MCAGKDGKALSPIEVGWGLAKLTKRTILKVFGFGEPSRVVLARELQATLLSRMTCGEGNEDETPGGRLIVDSMKECDPRSAQGVEGSRFRG